MIIRRAATAAAQAAVEVEAQCHAGYNVVALANNPAKLSRGCAMGAVFEMPARGALPEAPVVWIPAM